jgi:putative ABC transport system ATP-binding protein
MIEITDLCKCYKEKALFSNFNLKVEDGAFAVIYGKSGCGKTTLLNMIGGIEPYESGQILVDGMDIGKKRNKTRYLRSEVGFLFQNFALVDNDSVLQNLKMISKNNRTDISFSQALELVGMGGAENKKIYQLSGGEQQRVALARLMVKKCKLVLADEPTGSLDVENANNVIGLLNDMRKMGKTIVVVTHSELFMDVATQVVRL